MAEARFGSGPMNVPRVAGACGVPVATSKARIWSGVSLSRPRAVRVLWMSAAAPTTIGDAPEVPPKVRV
jgi:hypothetical protein